MRLKNGYLAIALMSGLSLAACSNTAAGAKKDADINADKAATAADKAEDKAKTASEKAAAESKDAEREEAPEETLPPKGREHDPARLAGIAARHGIELLGPPGTMP